MRAGETAELRIEHVGVRGDGVARWRGAPVYVPFTAPGDVVRATLGAARGHGRVAAASEILSPGLRAAPPCAHFGACGGCALQHLDEAAYAATKLRWLEAALAQRGLEPGRIAPVTSLPPRVRRRARFHLEAGHVGFHARGTHRVVDLRECHVLHPELFALVAALRDLSAALLAPSAGGVANATLAANGIDLLLDLPAAPGLPQLEILARFAEGCDLARLSWRHAGQINPLALRRRPQASLSGVSVELPEQGFLQPSAVAETALIGAVAALAGGAPRIADLYAGIGTFTFGLARNARIHAVDGDEDAVVALARAAARAGLAGTVSSECRDLASRPLAREELAAYDAVILDPPYAGAKAQSHALAASAVSRVIVVSCNPASFARDARILVDSGYRLDEVRPFDAFLWSANLELVAGFERC